MSKSMHQTRDAVSDAVATEYELLRVRPDALLGCKCGDGKCELKDCDEVYAMTKDGSRFATVHGLGLQGRKMSDGATSIYRIPATRDSTAMRHCRSLAVMNERNSRFWAAVPEE
ncbi:MAG: hypothetical protein WCC37_05770 [Candidatus Sulfotelmatobacter sp.]